MTLLFVGLDGKQLVNHVVLWPKLFPFPLTWIEVFVFSFTFSHILNVNTKKRQLKPDRSAAARDCSLQTAHEPPSPSVELSGTLDAYFVTTATSCNGINCECPCVFNIRSMKLWTERREQRTLTVTELSVENTLRQTPHRKAPPRAAFQSSNKSNYCATFYF